LRVLFWNNKMGNSFVVKFTHTFENWNAHATILYNCIFVR
jgi:hypothetical protein